MRPLLSSSCRHTGMEGRKWPSMPADQYNTSRFDEGSVTPVMYDHVACWLKHQVGKVYETEMDKTGPISFTPARVRRWTDDGVPSAIDAATAHCGDRTHDPSLVPMTHWDGSVVRKRLLYPLS